MKLLLLDNQILEYQKQRKLNGIHKDKLQKKFARLEVIDPPDSRDYEEVEIKELAAVGAADAIELWRTEGLPLLAKVQDAIAIYNYLIEGLPSDSGHFAYSKNKQREIVEHFRRDKAAGLISDKDIWAKRKYQISGRTLKRYEDKFPLK